MKRCLLATSAMALVMPHALAQHADVGTIASPVRNVYATGTVRAGSGFQLPGGQVWTSLGNCSLTGGTLSCSATLSLPSNVAVLGTSNAGTAQATPLDPSLCLNAGTLTVCYQSNFGTAAIAAPAQAEQTRAQAAEALLAPKASPTFTGTLTLPDNSTLTGLGASAGKAYPGNNPSGFVTAAQAASAAPVQSVAGRQGAISLSVGDVSGAAPLASPGLTGTPTAPTQSAGDTSTALATDAFAMLAIGVEQTRALAAEAGLLPKSGGTLTGTVTNGTFSGGDVSAETIAISNFGTQLAATAQTYTWNARQFDITSSQYWIWPANSSTRVDELPAYNDVKAQAAAWWSSHNVIACVTIPPGIDTSGGTGPKGIVLGGGAGRGSAVGMYQQPANTPQCVRGEQLGNSRIAFDPALTGQSGSFNTQGAFFDPHFDGSHVPWGTMWNGTLSLPTGPIYAGSYLSDLQTTGPGVGSSSGVTTQPQIDLWGLNAYTVIQRIRVLNQRGGCLRLGFSPGDPNSTADGNANATNFPGGFLESAIIDVWCVQTGDAQPHAQSDPYSTGTLTTLGATTPSIWLTSISGTKAGSNTVYFHDVSNLQARGVGLEIDSYPQKFGGSTSGIVFGGLTRVEHAGEDIQPGQPPVGAIQIGATDSSVTVGGLNIYQSQKISFENTFLPTPPNGGFAIYVPCRSGEVITSAPQNLLFHNTMITSGNRGQGDGWYLCGHDIRMDVTQSVLSSNWFDGVFGEPALWAAGATNDPTNVIVEGTNVNAWSIGQVGASFTGSVTCSSPGTCSLVVSSVAYGTVSVATGSTLKGVNIDSGLTITAQTSGTPGGAGTYTLANDGTQTSVVSEPMLDIGIPTSAAAADHHYSIRGSAIWGNEQTGLETIGSAGAAGTLCVSGTCMSVVAGAGGSILTPPSPTPTNGDVATWGVLGNLADGGALGTAAFKAASSSALGTLISMGTTTMVAGDTVVWNGSVNALIDGGPLGQAASKAVTGSGLGTVVSLGAGAHTAGDLASFADNNGSVKDAGTAASVVAANMPTPGASQLGGAFSASCGSGSFVSSLSTAGSLSCGAPTAQVYPGAGVPVSTGSAWGTSLSHVAKTSSAPTITGSTSITLGTCSNTGTYEQIGSEVFYHGSLNCTVTALGGNLQVSLPVASASDGISQSVNFNQVATSQSWPTTVATQLVGRIPPASSFFYIEGNKNAGGATVLSSSNGCTAGCTLNLNFSAIYDTGSGS